MTDHASPGRIQLLVSVQNVREAQLARSLTVPWIDLKNPALGSLGSPDILTARKVAAELSHGPACSPCQTSVALGELRTLHVPAALELMRLFPIAKIGLAGLGTLRRISPSMRQRLDSLQSQQPSCQQAGTQQIVLAIYADHQRAGSPAPADVVEMARHLGSRYVLVDTFIKDGRGLFQWLGLEQLEELREQAAAFGAALVVAGSLKTSDWAQLSRLAPLIVGVRGGVCASGEDRSSRLSPERVREWLEWTLAAEPQ